MYNYKVPWHKSRAASIAEKNGKPEKSWKMYDARILGCRRFSTYAEANAKIPAYMLDTEPSDAGKKSDLEKRVPVSSRKENFHYNSSSDEDILSDIDIGFYN